MGLFSRRPRPAPPSPAPPPLAEVLRQVRRLELRTRGRVASRFSGDYHSVFKGQGMEFVEVREYLHGDDVRTIDWNVSARTGGVYVKKFVEERELTVMLLVDVSASQAWGTRGRGKDEVVAEAVAMLALAAARNGDRVGLLAFSDRVEARVAPRRGRRHVLRIVRDLLALRPAGRGTALPAHLERAARMLRGRSVLFVVSDFLVGDGMPALERALAAAAARHDVVPLVLGDPADGALPAVGLLRLVDPETGREEVADTADAGVRAAFAARAQAGRDGVTALFRRLGLEAVELRTDRPVAAALLSFFRRRERRIRR